MKNPRIYVILPVHNRLKTTKKFLDCLKNQTYNNYRLIMIDDGSTDGTANYAKEQIKNITILYGNGKLWWSGAFNKAYKFLSKIRPSHKDLIWINNDDTAFDTDYFEKMINDKDLNPKTLIISPGHSMSTDFVERGFSIHWPSMKTFKLSDGEEPDALTTRGLYMFYATYHSLGLMHPWLLPHYLSDLEYTIRAKKKGYRLVISDNTFIHVDRSNTGLHQDDSKTFKEFFYIHLFSKKSAFNTFYWGNFVLLASPFRYKFINILKIYVRFFRKLNAFILQNKFKKIQE